MPIADCAEAIVALMHSFRGAKFLFACLSLFRACLRAYLSVRVRAKRPLFL